MEEKSRGCLKQAALGCGGLLVVAVAVPVVLTVMILPPMNRAIEARADFEALHGPQDAFVPPASGVPSPDRIEAFLSVRQALAPACTDFWSAERSVAKLEAFDDQENISKIDVMKQAMSTSKTMMGMGPAIGHFFENRNRALVDAGMGLGEYTYIYVVAYNDRILEPETELQLFGPQVANGRVREALASMLKNQLEALRREGAQEELTRAVAAEVEALENDPDRIAWQDGIPLEIESSLLPYRDRLDTAFCGSTAPFELLINEKRFLAIESL
jgi:hypothetical protein